MRPSNPKNFLIEVTPDLMSEIEQLLDPEGDRSVIMHFSPFWRGDKK